MFLHKNPNTYTASETSLTALGENQNYLLGQMLRNIYADVASPNAISGLSNTTFIAAQINSTADGGGEGGVIADSAVAMWQVSGLCVVPTGRIAHTILVHQGFYPPNPR